MARTGNNTSIRIPLLALSKPDKGILTQSLPDEVGHGFFAALKWEKKDGRNRDDYLKILARTGDRAKDLVNFEPAAQWREMEPSKETHARRGGTDRNPLRR